VTGPPVTQLTNRTGPEPTARPAGGTALRSDQLPAFVGIGALKAGTTTLDALLRAHPALCLPVSVKEVDFFGTHYERGASWYARQFDGCSERLHGEVSPRYLVDPSAPQRICAANPNARLLLVVREPVDRLWSQFRYRRQTTGYRGDFEAYLADNPGAVERGRYHHHLTRFLDWFPLAQVHVTVFDDLVQSPSRAAADVFAFLGLPALARGSVVGVPGNASFNPRMPRAYACAKSVSRALYSRGHGRLATRLASTGFAARLRTSAPSDRLTPPSDRRVRSLRDAYADDVAALSELLGVDLAARWWSAQAERGS
jgi:Sulfotransferase domain